MNIKIKTLLSLGAVSIIGVCSALPINATSNETLCKKVLCDNKSYEEYLSVNINGKECLAPIKPLHYLIQDILNNKSTCSTDTSSKRDTLTPKQTTHNVDTTQSKHMSDLKSENNVDSNTNKSSTNNADTTNESKSNLETKDTLNFNQKSKSEVKDEQPSNPSNKFVDFQKEVSDLVNKERINRGLQPLKLNLSLSNVATLKSQDMINKNYFDHTSPTYGSPFDMMKKFGISYNYAGENIAMGQENPQEVMNSWMNSNGHRKNILNPNFTELGVGIAFDGSSLYWTQMFIGK